MPFVLLVLAASIVGGRLVGGRVGNLVTIRLQRTWLVFLAVAVQVGLALVTLAGGPGEALGLPLMVVSHVALLAFIAVNRTQPGMLLVLLGLALNAAVILANGAMPVAPEAVAALGGGGTIDPGKHEALTDETLLPWLADVIPVPPLRSIISVGDLVLAVGVGRLVVTRMRRPDCAAG